MWFRISLVLLLLMGLGWLFISQSSLTKTLFSTQKVDYPVIVANSFIKRKSLFDHRQLGSNLISIDGNTISLIEIKNLKVINTYTSDQKFLRTPIFDDSGTIYAIGSEKTNSRFDFKNIVACKKDASVCKTIYRASNPITGAEVVSGNLVVATTKYEDYSHNADRVLPLQSKILWLDKDLEQIGSTISPGVIYLTKFRDKLFGVSPVGAIRFMHSKLDKHKQNRVYEIHFPPDNLDEKNREFIDLSPRDATQCDTLQIFEKNWVCTYWGRVYEEEIRDFQNTACCINGETLQFRSLIIPQITKENIFYYNLEADFVAQNL